MSEKTPTKNVRLLVKKKKLADLKFHKCCCHITYVCVYNSTAEVSIQGGRKRKHLRAKKGRNIDYRSATARLRTSGKNLNPKDGFIFIFSLQSITLPDSKGNYLIFIWTF